MTIIYLCCVFPCHTDVNTAERTQSELWGKRYSKWEKLLEWLMGKKIDLTVIWCKYPKGPGVILVPSLWLLGVIIIEANRNKLDGN